MCYQTAKVSDTARPCTYHALELVRICEYNGTGCMSRNCCEGRMQITQELSTTMVKQVVLLVVDRQVGRVTACFRSQQVQMESYLARWWPVYCDGYTQTIAVIYAFLASAGATRPRLAACPLLRVHRTSVITTNSWQWQWQSTEHRVCGVL